MGQEDTDPDSLGEGVSVFDTVLHTVGLVVAEEEEEREGESVPVILVLPVPQELTLAELLWDGVSVADRVLVTDTLPQAVWLADTETEGLTLVVAVAQLV